MGEQGVADWQGSRVAILSWEETWKVENNECDKGVGLGGLVGLGGPPIDL